MLKNTIQTASFFRPDAADAVLAMQMPPFCVSRFADRRAARVFLAVRVIHACLFRVSPAYAKSITRKRRRWRGLGDRFWERSLRELPIVL